MTPLMRIAIAAAIFAATLTAQDPQQTPPNPQEIPRTRVRGRVVDAETNLPVKGARVAIGERSDASADAETDFEGRFDFPEAPTGDRTIVAYKSGYAQNHNRIRIPVGRELEGVRLEMHRSAVITGRVIGPGGLPMPGAQVSVMRRTYADGGPAYLPSSEARMFGGGSTTDDRGLYRAWGLRPGPHIVAVIPVAEPGPRGETVYSTSGLYYPNANSVAEAGRVRVDWGQIQENVDFELGPPANTRVEGVMRQSEPGGDCQNCSASLHRKEGDAWLQAGFIGVGRDGSFSIAGLTPGHYALAGRAFVMRTSSMSFGAAEFDVIDGQVTPVLIDLYGEQPVSGRIVLEDPPETVAGPDAEPWQAGIQFRGSFGDPFTAPGSRGSYANASGKGAEVAFELTPMAGKQTLHLRPAPAGGYVREISIDGRPLEDADITLPVGGLKNVVVTVAFDTGKVAGRVSGVETMGVEPGLLPPAAVIWLIPEGGHGRFLDRLIRGAKPDGSFEIDGLPPGTYNAFAVPEETGRLMFDPSTASKLANWSRKVEIRPGQTTNLNLELAPELSSVE